jgi:methyl-accepting chemotaxis protein
MGRRRRLHKIGSEVSKRIEDVKLVMKKEQDKIGPEMQSSMETAMMLASVLALIAVVVSIGSGFFIGRSITLPIAGIVQAMERLARGDLAVDLKDANLKTEIGAMSRATQVFKDNAVRKLEMEREAEANRSASEQERLEREREKEREAEEIQFAVSQLAGGLEKLSGGDVSVRLDETFAERLDALRVNFNQSIAKLNEALTAVGANARAIDADTNEIRVAADDLSRRTEQQAASVEETSAALTEITTTVTEAARRATEAGELVIRTRTGAEKAGEVVNRAVSAMHQIEKSSGEISNIIGVIDEIAFQTNLLALNAGVEAARAGEAGKGFAVVAQEVRELAQRSATAAKEIKTLIGASSAQVEQGVELVGDTGRALEGIVADVQEISKHMLAIAESAKEQDIGIREINAAVIQMDQGTQQNAAMVEQTTAATHGLTREVSELSALLANFRLAPTEGRSTIAPPARLELVRDTVPKAKAM